MDEPLGISMIDYILQKMPGELTKSSGFGACLGVVKDSGNQVSRSTE